VRTSYFLPLAVLLCSCSSPIDIPTDRIETRFPIAIENIPAQPKAGDPRGRYVSNVPFLPLYELGTSTPADTNVVRPMRTIATGSITLEGATSLTGTYRSTLAFTSNGLSLPSVYPFPYIAPTPIYNLAGEGQWTVRGNSIDFLDKSAGPSQFWVTTPFTADVRGLFWTNTITLAGGQFNITRTDYTIVMAFRRVSIVR
jgi:hypothetical protein